jgi:hypothetical protein
MDLSVPVFLSEKRGRLTFPLDSLVQDKEIQAEIKKIKELKKPNSKVLEMEKNRLFDIIKTKTKKTTGNREGVKEAVEALLGNVENQLGTISPEFSAENLKPAIFEMLEL